MVGCAVVLWVLAGCLEVLSHEVVLTSVGESVVSCMCVTRGGVAAMLTAWCVCLLTSCAVS